jgi:hypothetical protein
MNHGDNANITKERKMIYLPKQEIPKHVVHALDRIQSYLYMAACEIDEFKILSLDRQGEVMIPVVQKFIDGVMDEIK